MSTIKYHSYRLLSWIFVAVINFRENRRPVLKRTFSSLTKFIWANYAKSSFFCVSDSLSCNRFFLQSRNFLRILFACQPAKKPAANETTMATCSVLSETSAMFTSGWRGRPVSSVEHKNVSTFKQEVSALNSRDILAIVVPVFFS